MKILFITNIPSPYRVDFFNELGKYCELTVLFEKKGYSTRNESWLNYQFDTFKGIILKGVNLGTFEKLCFNIFFYLKKKVYDYVIVGNMTSLTGILSVFWLKIRHIPYGIEGDGGFAGNGKGLKEILKRWIISGAEICFSTSGSLDDYYLRYGASRDKIYRYPFTSLRKEELLERPLNSEEKLAIKQKAGISEPHILLSIGSFIPRKGMDVLIKASHGLGKDWGIYIIGGQPTSEYLELKEKYDMTQLHFVSYLIGQELADYYKAADLFVLATREDIWGLVINEALSYALPVITTRRCIAGVELIRDYVNGLLVEADDVEGLQKAIVEFTSSEKLRSCCAQGALKAIQKYTIEEMAQRHIEILSGFQKTRVYEE